MDNKFEIKDIEINIKKPNYVLKIGNLSIDIIRQKRFNKFQKFMLYKVFGIEVEEIK